MKLTGILAVLLTLSGSVSKAEITPQVVLRDSAAASFLIPVAGNTPGANNTFFRSDLMFANYRNVEQSVTIQYLPRGQNNTVGGPISRTVVMPAGSIRSIRNIVGEMFGAAGIGSLIVSGIRSDGTPDSLALLDGFSRISTPLPGSISGTTSQSFPAVSTRDLLGNIAALALGLRQDQQFRTNVGVVNLDTVAHTYTIAILGANGSGSTTLTVPAMSVEQIAIPAGNFGDLGVFVRPTDVTTAAAWSAYASSVDNVSGDGWVSHAAAQP